MLQSSPEWHVLIDLSKLVNFWVISYDLIDDESRFRFVRSKPKNKRIYVTSDHDIITNNKNRS